MKCENEFCIYQENGKCILKEVSLDILGQCTDCIYADFDKDALNDAKMKTRNRIYKK